MVGTRISGWCGVSPNGLRRRSMKAVRMPADFAPMAGGEWQEGTGTISEMLLLTTEAL